MASGSLTAAISPPIWRTGPVGGHAIPILNQSRPATGAKAEGSASKYRKHISTSCTEISP
jgi:hypothetical protein